MQQPLPQGCGPPRAGPPAAIPQVWSRRPGPRSFDHASCIPTQTGPGFGSAWEGPSGGPGPGAGVNFDLLDPREVAEALKVAFAEGAIFRTRPSPIDAIPYRGWVPSLVARAVLAPPTAPGDAEGATAAQALSAAAAAFGGTAPAVLTPDTVDDAETVLEYEVERGQAFVLRGVGVAGHDSRAQLDAVRWRVLAGGQLVVPEVELGQFGTLAQPAFAYGVAREGQKVEVLARNLDTQAPSLVTVRLFGWVFPVKGNEDALAALIDPRG